MDSLESAMEAAAMLVLSRKTDEQILIGDSIVVTVVRIGSNEVRIGIDAPPDVDIIRTELLETVDTVREPAMRR